MLPGVDPLELSRMRPDLLIVRDLPCTCTGRADEIDKEKHTVYILEVGYCGDTQHDIKAHEKAEQHKRLADLLREEGWHVRYCDVHAISLGYAGTIRKNLMQCLTQELGMPTSQADALCRALHIHAVESTSHIITARRATEKQHPG